MDGGAIHQHRTRAPDGRHRAAELRRGHHRPVRRPVVCDDLSGRRRGPCQANLTRTPTDDPLRFRYWTDGSSPATASRSTTSRSPASRPTARETDPGWTYRPGFHRTTGTVTSSRTSTHYVAEYRNYSGYDQALKLGPYNFGFDPTGRTGRALPVPGRPADLVLRHLVRRQQRRRPPGQGLILPVDAHPAIIALDATDDGTAAAPVVRLDVRPRKDRSRSIHSTAFGTLNFPSQARCPILRRQPELLPRQRSGRCPRQLQGRLEQREPPAHGHGHQGGQRRRRVRSCR